MNGRCFRAGGSFAYNWRTPMNLTPMALGLTLVLMQQPLWFGDGGWVDVTRFDAQIALQRAENERLRTRTQDLTVEVRDIKQGLAAVEERARSDLGMIGPGEVFFQVVEADPASP